MKFKRILLKVSGEALIGDKNYGIDPLQLEQYSNLLKNKKINHTVLNAKNHEKEAEIIANAGKTNSVIITTSISGRGVDIQLGGKKGSVNEDELKK